MADPHQLQRVPEIATRQHYYPILSVWRQDQGERKSYTMCISAVRAYVQPPTPAKP